MNSIIETQRLFKLVHTMHEHLSEYETINTSEDVEWLSIVFLMHSVACIGIELNKLYEVTLLVQCFRPLSKVYYLKVHIGQLNNTDRYIFGHSML